MAILIFFPIFTDLKKNIRKNILKRNIYKILLFDKGIFENNII
jgi:hypothetical protein